MKKYGTMTLIIAMLALAASLGKAALTETAHDRVSAIAQQSGFAAVSDIDTAAPVPAPEAPVAPAGELGVKITSFVMTESSNPNNRLAEICGKVTGSDADFTVVRIVVDPKSNAPGTYNTLAGKDGAFCSVVVTYTRTASASVNILGRNSTSIVATASGAGTR